MSMNLAVLVGNVGRDPEIRTMGNGDKVANFSIATSETWRDKATGERHEATEWHNVVVFNQALIPILEQFVKKGSKVSLQGAIKTRVYKTREGDERKATEIVLDRFRGVIGLEGDPRGVERSPESYGSRSSKPASGGDFGRSSGSSSSSSSSGRSADLDDDIPF